MARSLITQVTTLTAAYTGTRFMFQIETGPIALLMDYTKGSSTSIDCRIDFGINAPLNSTGAAPDVTVDTDWWTPATAAGAADNVINTTTAGKQLIDLSTRLGSTTAGGFGFNGWSPSGIAWIRVAFKVNGTATGNTLTSYLLYNTNSRGV